ncbi:MAG: hypothetical protein IT531_00100 [Burkholderiales bacterium]|nr:hypothetical protein [Burkholderiales bacterium]
MALVVVDQAENIILEAIVNKTAPQALDLKLYKNNVTPAETDTEATYTEADFTGYADIALAGGDWAAASGGSIATAAQKVFTASGTPSGSVYGYYLTQQTSGKLMWAERDGAAPFTIAAAGDTVKVTPTITAS